MSPTSTAASSGVENFSASAAFAMTNRAPPREMRSARSAAPSAPVVGMMIAPSLATASIDSHSSTWLPSIRMTRSPLPTPSERNQVATRSERSAICANVTFCSLPSCSTIHSAVRSLSRAITSNQSVAQLNAPVRRGHSKVATALS